MVKKTSFGSTEILLEVDNKIVSEFLKFNKEGRSHSHNEWEICHIIKGQGSIIIGDKSVEVSEGDTCTIPPNTNHWMIPDPHIEILIVYLKKQKS